MENENLENTPEDGMEEKKESLKTSDAPKASIERYNIRIIEKPKDVTKTPERDPRNDDSVTRALMLKSIKRKKRRQLQKKLLVLLIVVLLLVAAFLNRKLLLKIKPVADAADQVTAVTNALADESAPGQVDTVKKISGITTAIKKTGDVSNDAREDTTQDFLSELDGLIGDVRSLKATRESVKRTETKFSPLGALAEFFDKDTGIVAFLRKISGAKINLRPYYEDYIKAQKDTAVFGEDREGMVNYSETIAQTMSDEKLYRKEEAEASEKEAILAQADLLAAGYDYDGAYDLVETISNYDKDTEITERIVRWQAAKKELKEFKATDVTSISYDTLVVDPDLAFKDGLEVSDELKQRMTTVTEFNNITQAMYEEGYVLCSLYDFFEEETGEDGAVHFKEKSVYLPKDKKPFILTLSDLNYYHAYAGCGMASKLVSGDDGKVTCEYEKSDGTVVTGSYDCVPLLNDFMEEHPDGAYHGARGTIALTGYNGVFGYRTDAAYQSKKNLDDDQLAWLEAHPDYNRDTEVAEAKKIAQELKEEGWTFASKTWGNINVEKISYSKMKKDVKKWIKYVEPIVGETDCMIFPNGKDISDADDYDTANKKYKYLTKKGFHIFLREDSEVHSLAIHDSYVHGGIRSLDGQCLWKNADDISDLFKAGEVIDPARTDMPN